MIKTKIYHLNICMYCTKAAQLKGRNHSRTSEFITMLSNFLNNIKCNSKVTGAKSSSVINDVTPPILCPQTKQKYRKTLDRSRSGRKTILQRHVTRGSAEPKSAAAFAPVYSNVFGEGSLDPIREDGPMILTESISLSLALVYNGQAVLLPQRLQNLFRQK